MLAQKQTVLVAAHPGPFIHEVWADAEGATAWVLGVQVSFTPSERENICRSYVYIST